VPDATQTVPPREHAATQRLIAHVEVALDAFVGAARLTVAEVAALKPGQSIALDAALDGAVELRLNGLVAARGELVAVGDKLGVRLTEVAG
jgi:flagellar motor switch protein FliN/FliY